MKDVNWNNQILDFKSNEILSDELNIPIVDVIKAREERNIIEFELDWIM